jgi:hypothetical protein
MLPLGPKTRNSEYGAPEVSGSITRRHLCQDIGDTE